LLLAAVALSGYLSGVRRIRATDPSWPVGRICWAVGATVVGVVALNSGVATYDGVVWSVTVTQQAITSMVVPLAIVLARPWELIAPGIRSGRLPISPAARRTVPTLGRLVEAARTHPLLVLAGFVVWTLIGLLSPLALWSVTHHGLLMLFRVSDIVIGTALFAILLPAPRSTDRQRAPSAMTLLMAWFAGQVALTGVLLAGGAIAVRPWFAELNIAWITVASDERTAALIHLGIATGVLLVVAALSGQTSGEIRTSNTTARNIRLAAIASANASE
jgi:putative copper resistance protein D